MNSPIITISSATPVKDYVDTILAEIESWNKKQNEVGKGYDFHKSLKWDFHTVNVKYSSKTKELNVFFTYDLGELTPYSFKEKCFPEGYEIHNQNVCKCGCFFEYEKKYVVYLHDDTLSFVQVLDTRFIRCFSPFVTKYSVTGVKNFVVSPDNKTIVIFYEDGSYRSYGQLLYDSKRDYLSAEMKHYGRCLEDGFKRLDINGYTTSDHDIRDNYSGMFGIDSNGKPLVIAHQNLAIDPDWYLNINDMTRLEALENIIKFDCIEFTTLDKSRTELRSKGIKKLYYPGKQVADFSNSIYYGVFVDNTGSVKGGSMGKGCTSFRRLKNAKKVLAFPLGTVVLSEDGKLKSFCTDYTVQAYENLPVESGVKDIARSSSVFVILCENGDLYGCKEQASSFTGTAFETKPYGQWELMATGIDHLECFGEEILACPID